ncbi:MAG: hypothetical protein IIZ78_16825 [Clostridiales bacterium]|nr:hypothetical protein [Clostridiales bacterium]
MDKVIINEQDILNANANLPLVLKYTLAKYIAELCVEKKQITLKEDGEDSIPLPDMAQRNTLRESQFKIGVFVKEYLKNTFVPVKSTNDKEIPYLMAADDADKWSDFETQIDRLKKSKNKEVADKCFDILNDYHAFCRMVSIEIEQELQIKNDIVGRFAWIVSVLLRNTTPEKLNETLEEIRKMQEQLESKEE